jgi:hypothetical protein
MDLTVEGNFRGMATSWRVIAPEGSQSVGIGVMFIATEEFNRSSREWETLAGGPWETEGAWWVRKKDGTLSERAFEELCGLLGWDGDPATVAANPTLDALVSFRVKAETYEGKTRHKASFLAPFDSTPGGGGGASVEEAGVLAQQFGSQARAFAAQYRKEPQRPEAGEQEPNADPPF